MLNKKGMTLVEVVVSITLTSIVLIFMFNMLISVKNVTDRNNTKSEYLLIQTIITREAQKDFNLYGLESVQNCELTSNYDEIIPKSADLNNSYCIHFTYNSAKVEANDGYLVYYSNNNKNYIGYIRADKYIPITKTLRKVENSPLKSSGYQVIINKDEIEYSSYHIEMPLYDDNLNDYSIILNYIEDN